jgi:hypothetical protein
MGNRQLEIGNGYGTQAGKARERKFRVQPFGCCFKRKLKLEV